jgi:hypothetical protein
MVHCPPGLVQGIEGQIERVVDVSRKILKQEWEKVKRLE